MKLLHSLSLLMMMLIAVAPAWCEGAAAPPGAEPAAGVRKELSGLTVLVLKGTPEAMGEQLGRLAAQEIQTVVKERLLEGFVEKNFLGREEMFYKEVGRREPLVPEDTRRALKALAEAAQVKYGDVLALQFVPPMRVSSMAIARGAYTVDGSFLLALQEGPGEPPVSGVQPFLIIRHPEGGTPFATLEYPGIISVTTAFCRSGAVIHLAWSASLDHAAGVPDALLLEKALRTPGDTESFINGFIQQERVYGGNLVLVSPERKDVTLLEMSSNYFVRTFMEGDLLVVTNHFTSPLMNYLVEEKMPLSEERCDELKKVFEEEKGKADVPLLDQLLSGDSLFSDYAKICIVKGDRLFIRLFGVEEPVTLSCAEIFGW